MPVTTLSAAVHIAPGMQFVFGPMPATLRLNTYPITVVVKTLLRHSKDKADRIAHSKEDQVPTDDLFFDLLVP